MLEQTQKTLRGALLVENDGGLAALFGDTAPRFSIHRRHFIRSLTLALEKTFPAVVGLVDRRFFAYAADTFIRTHPPATPCLFEYGDAFPEFLETFPAAASLPYLGDVARMEWVIHCVLHAPDAGNSALPAFVRLFVSEWPADAIWRLALGRSEARVDADSGAARLLFYRHGDDVKFESLTPGQFEFFTAMIEHGDVTRADISARFVDASFDLHFALAQLRRAISRPDLSANMERQLS